MDKIIDYAFSLLPQRLRYVEGMLSDKKYQSLRELRLRVGHPLMAECLPEALFFDTLTPDDIRYTVEKISDHSLSSIREKLRQGFVTLKYGCRVGLAGQAVIKNGQIDTVSDINGISIRIPREKRGCADGLLPYITAGGTLRSAVILSPPMMGKTTLLREIARLLGQSFNVCIIDERSEIAACSMGVPQFDVGIRTDVLDNVPKAIGIPMAIRSLSPNVIITDEIGGTEDRDALADAARCGCAFVASMHAASLEDAKSRKGCSALLTDGTVKVAVILSSRNVGQIERIIYL